MINDKILLSDSNPSALNNIKRGTWMSRPRIRTLNVFSTLLIISEPTFSRRLFLIKLTTFVLED